MWKLSRLLGHLESHVKLKEREMLQKSKMVPLKVQVRLQDCSSDSSHLRRSFAATDDSAFRDTLEVTMRCVDKILDGKCLIKMAEVKTSSSMIGDA